VPPLALATQPYFVGQLVVATPPPASEAGLQLVKLLQQQFKKQVEDRSLASITRASEAGAYQPLVGWPAASCSFACPAALKKKQSALD